ncbi:PIG-L deacetylase family protein [Streptantibioticus rubrisoli]|uniref:PIG-L family deacetylase n=1 Tax=Streptantibioticus rubrisoli TaxID=1387313 RepID=A0ABT1PAL9_9ACTN|nr:PIG-L deacetylase family protein [Streptantibioticus rubrisoli]MCQ4041493.1 PIG-L family deacetylase [Streptantibioticus rubrisoli]
MSDEATGPGTRVLAIVAHPDDADFKAGGTIALWTGAGAQVSYLVLTDGSAGGEDPAAPRERLAAVRQREQRAAAAALGVRDVHFLGRLDGQLSVDEALRRDITRVIRQVRPHRAVIQSPEINWGFLPDLHPDHRAAGEAALAALYPDARNPRAFPELMLDEGLRPWTVSEIWVVAGPRPNTYIDVTGTFDRKLAALRAHVSQTAHRSRLADEVRSQLAQQAATGGLGEGRLAEAFQVI